MRLEDDRDRTYTDMLSLKGFLRNIAVHPLAPAVVHAHRVSPWASHLWYLGSGCQAGLARHR